MEIEYSQVSEKAKKSLEAWEAAKSFLREIDFFFEKAHPGKKFSVSNLDALVQFVAGSACTLSGESTNNASAAIKFSNQFEQIFSSLEKVRAQSEQIVNFSRKNENNISSVTLQDNNVLNSPKGNINAIDVLDQIRDAARQAFGNLAILFPLAFSEESSSFQENLGTLASGVNTIHKSQKDAADARKSIMQTKKSIEEIRNDIESVNSKVHATQESVESDRENIGNQKDQSKSALEEINQVLESTRNLKNQVEGFEAEFSQYENRITKHLINIKNIESQLNNAHEENQAREQEISRLTSEAEKMLAASTNVGLAKAFDDASKEYNHDAQKAKKEFFISIFALFLSTLPLIYYVLPLDGDDVEVTIAGVISRLIILIPAAWMATFVAQRYSSLAQLHREYRFKAAIAMSVEGFKRQAEQFREEIAGTAFVNLSEKPEYGPGHKTSNRSPNPILAYIIETIQKRFKKLGEKADTDS